MNSMNRCSTLHRTVLAIPLLTGLLGGSASCYADGTEKVLYSFCSLKKCHEGYLPSGTLIADGAGNLYGTTEYGGLHRSCDHTTCGNVFKLAPDGTEEVLHSFGGNDGANPYAGVIADKADNLYGTTHWGGNRDAGTVFRLAPDGTLTVLHQFQRGSDGDTPGYGSLIMDDSGNLFGTTEGGGGSTNCIYGCGTVFEIKADGEETVRYAFQGGIYGDLPQAGLVADKDGNLYGTTFFGGVDCGSLGCGTVFKVTPAGAETVLHSFTCGNDGCNPYGGLTIDQAGNLYGTTSSGGGDSSACEGGCGTVFKVAADGTETILHAFQGPDGATPVSGLVADKAGNLYGTASAGGRKRGAGTVFRLTPDGTMTVFRFKGKTGRYPVGGLLLGGHGVLYGTTGGSDGGRGGTVFSLQQ